MARACEIETWRVSGSNGFVMRKVGSGRSPVSRRSGKAVTKMTGTSARPRISRTASRPELSSASWMSARISSGSCSRASWTASLWVVAKPTTVWPLRSTVVAMSSAITGSSSMIRIRVARCERSSTLAASSSACASRGSSRMIRAASSAGKPSSAVSTRICRRGGARCSIR